MNFCDVESGTVVSTLALTLTSSWYFFLERRRQHRTKHHLMGYSPSLAEIGRVADLVRGLLVIDHDHDAPRVSKLILVRVGAYHFPGDARVGANERVAVFVLKKVVADRSNTHDETGRRRREHTTVIVRKRDRMEM